MSLISYKRGQGSIILRVKILNSSVATGAGLTGLTSASTGLIIAAIADNEATTTAYTVAASKIETIATLGAFAAPTDTKCRFKEVDATNHPGVYEIQLADARYAVSAAKSLLVSVLGAANAAQYDVTIPLTDVDPYDGARGGMSALPNAVAGANGGLPLGDASGRVDVGCWLGTACPTPAVAGVPTVDAGTVASVAGDVGGKVIGGGSGTITGVGARVSLHAADVSGRVPVDAVGLKQPATATPGTCDYGSTTGTVANYLGTDATTSLVNVAPSARIQVDGWLTGIRIRTYTPGDSLAGVRVRIWRDAGLSLDASNYIGEARVSGDTLTDNVWADFTAPIAVNAGDAVGLRFTNDATHYVGTVTITAGTEAAIRYESTDKTTSVAWTSSSTSRLTNIETRGYRPDLVYFGDSISCGNSYLPTASCWATPVENGTEGGGSDDSCWYAKTSGRTDVTDYRNPRCSPWRIVRELAGFRAATGRGHRDKNATWGNTKWAQHITPYIDPGTVVVCNFGIIDLVVSGTTFAAHQASWDAMLAQAVADGATLVRQSIVHLGSLCATRMGSGFSATVWNPLIDQWNADMAAWCLTNGVQNIDVTDLTTDPWYETDSYIHPNEGGYNRIGAIVAQALCGANVWRIRGEQPESVIQTGAAAAIVAAGLDHTADDLADGGRLDLILDEINVNAAETLAESGTLTVAERSAVGAAVSGGLDRTGFKLASDGLDAIADVEPTGKPTNFIGWARWLIQKSRRSTMTKTAAGADLVVRKEDGTAITTQALTDDGTTQTVGPPS